MHYVHLNLHCVHYKCIDLKQSLISQYQKDVSTYTEPTTEWSHGLCEAYALLDSAYYLSQLVSIFFVQTLLQFTKSPMSYTASSAIFGCLGIFAATQVYSVFIGIL